MLRSLVGSEMCIRDRYQRRVRGTQRPAMVKSYLRYELASSAGVMASPASNTCWHPRTNMAVSAGLESVQVWDLKKGALRHSMVGGKSEVTKLELSNGAAQVAAGYGDGCVRTWGVDGSAGVTLHGHRSAVTALRYNDSDALLASGSKDTEIVVWDVVAEAGLYRLRGHKDGITDLAWVRGEALLSSSKDTLVKVWQLSSQHCVQTIVGHRHAVWSLDVNTAATRMVTGSEDAELRVFDVTIAGEPDGIKPLGSVRRASKDRALQVRFHPDDQHVGCLGADKALEIFRIRSDDESKQRLAKRNRQRKKKAEEAGQDVEDMEPVQLASVELVKEATVSSRQRIRSFCWGLDATQVLFALHDNSMSTYKSNDDTGKRTGTIDRHGHRSGIRCVALSSDSSHLVTCSEDSAKVWAVKGLRLVQTLETPQALTACFILGSYNYVVVGSKSGTLSVCDVSAGAILHQLPDAHTGNIWSTVCSHDGKMVVSAGADKMVRFWKLGLAPRSSTSDQKLKLIDSHSMEMSDEVLSVTLTRNGKLVAIAMLDCTVKVFYEESLKFFLSLYGHKLPVLSIDAADDSTILATASADKSIKLWGLDFGDMHKSFHAHDDSVTSVKFVPGSHYFFSSGKDKMIKYWDGDTRELVLAMPCHQAEVWSVAVSHVGDFMISVSNDRSIRLWERTEDQVFVEEERENALEELFDSNLDDGAQVALAGAPSEGVESGLASKTSSETLMSSERLFEAVELAEEDEKRQLQHEQSCKLGRQTAQALGKLEGYTEPAMPEPNILLLGKTGPEYLMSALAGTSAASLEHSLLLLPFSSAMHLLKPVSYTHLRAHETPEHLVCRLLLEKKKKTD
eukprot:TRINITY_DN4096_c0_g1_i3.p1 TRINITY_DN4096_c0_g1~~TRINITY_DN4096_c0_g1_i3.p1  ORF type:complete len:886 (-),score=243.24 TRINITY_DN4096_c0_g1_i3:66-2615(-)